MFQSFLKLSRVCHSLGQRNVINSAVQYFYEVSLKGWGTFLPLSLSCRSAVSNASEIGGAQVTIFDNEN